MARAPLVGTPCFMPKTGDSLMTGTAASGSGSYTAPLSASGRAGYTAGHFYLTRRDEHAAPCVDRLACCDQPDSGRLRPQPSATHPATQAHQFADPGGAGPAG